MGGICILDNSQFSLSSDISERDEWNKRAMIQNEMSGIGILDN